MPDLFRVRFYGVRGSIPTPMVLTDMHEKLEAALALARPEDLINEDSKRAFLSNLPFHIKACLGGNSACVQIAAGDHHLIFDAGSGIRVLGLDLMKGGFARGEGSAHLFFSHTHWDHIMGLPFFTPLYIPGNQFTLCAVHPGLAERLRGQQQFQYFPVSFDAYNSTITFQQLGELDRYELGDVTITWNQQHHPGKSYAYRVSYGGKSVVYATDAEYKDPTPEGLKDTVAFFKDADLVIFDSQYTQIEAMEKTDWGHSSTFIGIKIALAAGVKKLAFFHHEPTYSDFQLVKILESSQEFLHAIAPDGDLELVLAAEGEMHSLFD